MQDINFLSQCVMGNSRKYKALTEEKLQHKHELPCGCEEVTLENLLCNYECTECGEVYYYSFCMKEVVYENNTWHCNNCGTCRESAEWHCKKCNDCTYGLTLKCDRRGKKSPYAV